jgi:uncharacterized protein
MVMDKDVLDAIINSFSKENKDEAIDLINTITKSHVMAKCDYNLKNTHLSVVYLAKGNLKELAYYVNCAKKDFRDVIYWVRIVEKREKVINETVKYVKKELKNAEGGHDWWHVYRVCKLAKTIAKEEKANMFIVELCALLHDIADSKFNNGDEEIGPKKARDFLTKLKVEEEDIIHIENIISNISFKGGKEKRTFNSPELDIIQDADRLDALGAIGIARTFNYGGFKNHKIYDPTIPPNLNMTKEEYKKSKAPTLNHFYEKLLLLKDKMNTKTGKEIAVKRHHFMENYLKEFYLEWDGKL